MQLEQLVGAQPAREAEELGQVAELPRGPRATRPAHPPTSALPPLGPPGRRRSSRAWTCPRRWARAARTARPARPQVDAREGLRWRRSASRVRWREAQAAPGAVWQLGSAQPGADGTARRGAALVRGDRGRRAARADRPRPPRRASSRGRRRRSTPSATTSRARPRTWPPTCSRSTRSTSARAGSRRCASGPGCSGYFTVAWALADQFRGNGPWSPDGAARARRRGGGAGARPGAGPRADGALRAGAATTSGRFLGRARARSTSSRRPAARPSGWRRRSPTRCPSSTTRGFCKRAQITAERPGPGRRGRVRRPRPAHDLRRQPGAARAARGRRAASTTRRWPRASTPSELLPPGRARSARSAPARCTPAS